MKFLLVDDHPLFGLGFSALCEQLEPAASLTMADSFEVGQSFLSEQVVFDLVFIDLNLPDGNGLELLKLFRTQAPQMPCVMMSAHCDPEVVSTALAQGASGFISKSDPSVVTLKAIELVLSGGIYIPKEAMPNRVEKGRAGVSETTANILTPKQQQILACLAKGNSNKQIAQAVCLSEGTVRNYLSAIFEILEVKNRAEAVSVARSKGLLNPWS